MGGSGDGAGKGKEGGGYRLYRKRLCRFVLVQVVGNGHVDKKPGPLLYLFV